MSHESCTRNVKETYEKFRPRKHVIEIGSRDINGSIRSLFCDGDYVGVDLYPGPGVDVVADAEQWRPDERADLVVCVSVLEHHPRPYALIDAAYEMLEPDGIFIVHAAHTFRPHSAIDGAWGLKPGEWYKNVTEPELRAWMKNFKDVVIWTDAKDIYGYGRR